MKRRGIALILMLALLWTGLAGAAGVAEARAGSTVKLKLGVKETYQINASTIPGALGRTLEYRSSNAKIATVSAGGVITAKRKGSVRIGVGYGKTLLALYRVTVCDAPKKLTLSDRTALLYVGESKQLKAKLPARTASASISYKSSDVDVATVDAAGKVTAVGSGSATITATTFNNRTAKCAVTVLSGKAPSALGVNAARLVLRVGESFKLVPAVEAGSSALYRYASKDGKVAEVSSDGTVRGVKKGSTTVTVATSNGLTKKVSVTVVKKFSPADVYGYLSADADVCAGNAGKLGLKKDEDAGFAGTRYADDQMTLSLEANACGIRLKSAGTPRYCLLGLHTAMTPDQAAALLIDQGWAQTSQSTSGGVEIRAYAKPGDATHILELSTKDGKSLQAIAATLKW